MNSKMFTMIALAVIVGCGGGGGSEASYPVDLRLDIHEYMPDGGWQGFLEFVWSGNGVTSRLETPVGGGGSTLIYSPSRMSHPNDFAIGQTYFLRITRCKSTGYVHNETITPPQSCQIVAEHLGQRAQMFLTIIEPLSEGVSYFNVVNNSNTVIQEIIFTAWDQPLSRGGPIGSGDSITVPVRPNLKYYVEARYLIMEKPPEISRDTSVIIWSPPEDLTADIVYYVLY